MTTLYAVQTDFITNKTSSQPNCLKHTCSMLVLIISQPVYDKY